MLCSRQRFGFQIRVLPKLSRYFKNPEAFSRTPHGLTSFHETQIANQIRETIITAELSQYVSDYQGFLVVPYVHAFALFAHRVAHISPRVPTHPAPQSDELVFPSRGKDHCTKVLPARGGTTSRSIDGARFEVGPDTDALLV